MSHVRMRGVAALAAVVALGAVSVASADEFVGLVTPPTGGPQSLIRFNSDALGSITTVPIVTPLPNETLVDIDVFPVDRNLYGLSSAGNLYRIDFTTGVLTLDTTALSSLGSPVAIDFNPAADRLRVLSTNDENYRLTPSTNTAGPTGVNSGLVSNDGTVAYLGGLPSDPNLVAAGYTNSFDGTPSTALYSIDASADALVLHSVAPGFSTLNTVGSLGIDVTDDTGFDIAVGGPFWLTSGGNLYTVDSGSGTATLVGAINGTAGVGGSLRIAVVPEPGAAGLAGLVGSALLVRRRSR